MSADTRLKSSRAREARSPTLVHRFAIIKVREGRSLGLGVLVKAATDHYRQRIFSQSWPLCLISREDTCKSYLNQLATGLSPPYMFPANDFALPLTVILS